MLQVNKYGEILATNGGYYDLSDEDFLQELIAVTYSSTDMQGEIPQYHLRYSRYLLQNGQRLVFVDTTSEQATLHALGSAAVSCSASPRCCCSSASASCSPAGPSARSSPRGSNKSNSLPTPRTS